MNLGVLAGHDVLYLDVLESPHDFRLVSKIGMRRPMHCTGLGKAILAWQPAGFRDELLVNTKLQKLTAHSITRSAEMVSELGRIQRLGYAVDNEEAELGARCVAAPVFDSSSSIVAGISVSGPVIRMSRSRTTEIAKAVKRAALKISRHLGYPGYPVDRS